MAVETHAANPGTLAGRRILIVEDEFFIADGMVQTLEGSGAQVVGPVPTVDKALDLLRANGHLDAAVLDLNLRGREAYPVADALTAEGVPFLFATGYDQGALPGRYADAPRCQKPVAAATLLNAVGQLVA